MSENFNPMEVRVRMKRVDKPNGGYYYIGNTNMKIDTSDCMVMFHEPRGDSREGALIIKKYQPFDKEEEQD